MPQHLHALALSALGLVAQFCLTPVARGMDIDAALERGQQLELDRCEAIAADAPASRILHQTFERVLSAAALSEPISLRVSPCYDGIRVIGGEVVVNPIVADWSDGERSFVLAHELGHIVHGDWAQFKDAFRKAVPVDLPDSEVAARIQSLGPRLHELQYGFEYAADAFGAQLVTAMGREGRRYAFGAIRRVPVEAGDPTHPATDQRIAKLVIAGQ